MITVIKKDGNLEKFDDNKIIRACKLASERALDKLTKEDYEKICTKVKNFIKENYESNAKVSVLDLHAIVEKTLMELFPNSGEAYRQFRNYKRDSIQMLNEIHKKANAIRYIGDVSNANTDSSMVSTQRSLIYGELNKNIYKQTFLNSKELVAINDGYIYIHDMKDRLDSINCCLFDVGNVLKGGFEMGNVWYNEPKTLETAFDVISDLALSSASQEYGGWTAPRIDTILAPYAEKSYVKYLKEFKEITEFTNGEYDEKKADEYAMKKVYRDFEQGFQGWEYKFNTVASSRGDYPFIAISFGIDESRFGRMAIETALKTRMNGQGKKGHKKPVLFPKLTFLYDDNLHGTNKPMEYLFDLALQCSRKTMYPEQIGA